MDCRETFTPLHKSEVRLLTTEKFTKDYNISIIDEPQYSHTIAATQGSTFNKPIDLTLDSETDENMPTLTSSSDEDNSDSDSDTDLDISDKEYGSDSSDEDFDNCTQIVGNISDTTNSSTMNTTLSENGYHTDIDTTDDTSKKGLDLDTCSMFQKLTDVRKSYVSVLCAELDSQNEPNRRDSAERFVLDSGCTEHMVSEYVCLTDVHPMTSSVRFGNNGVLKLRILEI